MEKTLSSLPKKQRKIILVTDEYVYDKLYMDPKGNQVLCRPDTYILRINEIEDTNNDPIIKKIVEKKFDEPGLILFLSSFDDTEYEIADMSFIDFPKYKFTSFVQVCQFLGAKRVVIINKELSQGQTKINGKIEAQYKTVGGKVAADIDFFKRLLKEIDFQYVFKGGRPDLGKAEELIKNRGLRDNNEIRELIDLVKHKDNPPQMVHKKVHVYRETSTYVNIALEIGIIPILKGCANFEHLSKQNFNQYIEVEIEF